MHGAVTPVQLAIYVQLFGGEMVCDISAFATGVIDCSTSGRGGHVRPQAAHSEIVEKSVECEPVGDQVTGNSVGQVARDLID